MQAYKKRKYSVRKAPYTKKKSYARVRRNYDTTLSAMHLFPPYFADQPPRRYAKLRYSCQIEANHAAGAPNHYQFRANGLFDPEVAVGGHQPFGFDQLIARYQNFTVLYATCEAQFLQTTENFNSVWKLFVYKELNLPASMWSAGGANGMNEINIQSTNIIGAANQMIQKDRSTSKVFANIPKLCGVKNPEALIEDISYQGDIGHDPGVQCYFGLSGYGSEGAAEDTGHIIQVDITYYACFTKPVYMPTS